MATKGIKTVGSCTTLPAKNTATIASNTKPEYPLNLSSKTVATTSLAFFVCVAKSTLRKKSPPTVEGNTKLKNTPPDKETTTLFKGIWIFAALSSISQRNIQIIYGIKKTRKEKNKRGLSAFPIISSIFFSSTCLKSKNKITILISIRKIKERIFLKRCINLKFLSCN